VADIPQQSYIQVYSCAMALAIVIELCGMQILQWSSSCAGSSCRFTCLSSSFRNRSTPWITVQLLAPARRGEMQCIAARSTRCICMPPQPLLRVIGRPSLGHDLPSTTCGLLLSLTRLSQNTAQRRKSAVLPSQALFMGCS